MTVEQIIQDISLDVSVESVLRKLSAASSGRESFLRSNLEVAASLEQILDFLENYLKANVVSYDLTGDIWQDLEAPGYKVVEVPERVNVADYEQILRMWRTADEIYETLKSSMSGKIVVLFERS